MAAIGKLGRLALIALGAAATLSAPHGTFAQSAPLAEDEIRLWDKTPTGTSWTGPEQLVESTAPTGSKIKVKTNVTEPTLTVVRPLPGKANGTAVIIAPGGAFMALAWDLEGEEVARWFADRGVTAFILKYRVGTPPRNPSEPLPTGAEALLKLIEPNRRIAIADASQAMRLVRRDAGKYGIVPGKVGMIGFSAGAMTTLGVALEAAPDARPDFIIPVYGMMHAGDEVGPDAPPAFVVTATDDATIPPSRSISIFENWAAAKRPVELHVYERGQHGFGMREQGSPVDAWPAALERWLAARGLVAK